MLSIRILQKPELASEIDIEALGKLLPKELLEPLEEQYLSKRQVIQAYFSLSVVRFQLCIPVFSLFWLGLVALLKLLSEMRYLIYSNLESWLVFRNFVKLTLAIWSDCQQLRVRLSLKMIIRRRRKCFQAPLDLICTPFGYIFVVIRKSSHFFDIGAFVQR